MKYAVVYKSLTGNTELLAEAVRSELGDACVYFGEPDAKALDADVIFLGFWTDKGTCEESLKSFLELCTARESSCLGLLDSEKTHPIMRRYWKP